MNIEIRKSSIKNAGNGLFSTNFIPKDTIITEYGGKIVTEQKAQEMDNTNNLESLYYSLNMGNNKTLIGNKDTKNLQKCGQLINDAGCLKNPDNLDKQDAKKYIKTAEKVNCEFIIDKDKVFIKSIRDIKKDEELFIHYGYDYWLRLKYNDDVSIKKIEKDHKLYKSILKMDKKYMDVIFDTY